MPRLQTRKPVQFWSCFVHWLHSKSKMPRYRIYGKIYTTFFWWIGFLLCTPVWRMGTIWVPGRVQYVYHVCRGVRAHSWCVSLVYGTVHYKQLYQLNILKYLRIPWTENSWTVLEHKIYCSNPWINILNCAKAIPVVHAALYSLSALDWANGPGTCVPCSIRPPW